MSAADHHLRPVLIAGPTASGKSALAIAIAEHTGGVIVNADSMQVYRELRVLSARPTAEQEAARSACSLRLRAGQRRLFRGPLRTRC